MSEVRKCCRLVVDEMANDPQPVASGSQGTFEGYDGVGDLLMKWDCGSSLKLIDGVDKYHVISSDSELEVSLAHLRIQQEKISRDAEFECPRCGRKALYRTRALSRIADISVCEECGTIEAIIAAQAGGLNIKVSGADDSTARDFKRVDLKDWKMVRRWMGLDDLPIATDEE